MLLVKECDINSGGIQYSGPLIECPLSKTLNLSLDPPAYWSR